MRADLRERCVSQALLVDDNPLFRLGLRELIKAAQPKLAISEVETFAGARALLRESRDVALILLDIKVPDCGGFVGLFQLRKEFPQIPIIVLSTSGNAETVSRAVAFGAAGFILKSAPCDAISHTLKNTLSGESWTPVPIVASTDQGNPIASLSPALLRVLGGLKRGLRNKQIAFEMNVSEKTVKAYMSTIYRKLGVNNRMQALILLQEVLVEPVLSAHSDRSAA
ncbi:MAG TPA: response regulator transcription factor [Rhizomicrobium sp.]|nr:response regulator transcription factor [Rhizomicrobium sp.]